MWIPNVNGGTLKGMSQDLLLQGNVYVHGSGPF